MPSQSGVVTAVVVSGGKQYRVAPGDKILVDRLAAEPGTEITFDRVLLVDDGDDVRVGRPLVEGFELRAKVLGHKRGPKIDVIRYKSKKKVRVHRGARADLTAIEILTAGAEKPAVAKARPRRAVKAKSASADAGEEPVGTAADTGVEGPET